MSQAHTFGNEVVRFLGDLNPSTRLPKGITLLNPYAQAEVMALVKRYYGRFYSDNRPRVGVWGINPGRLGAGITGIPFTDPPALLQVAGIANPFPQKAESSATFVHEVMEAYGGIKKFTRSFFLTSVCPLGFVKGGKNFNYYDDALLMKRITPFILQSIERQLEFGTRTDVAICLGEGKNFEVLKDMNSKHRWFGRLIGLPHPRFVMQYRRKAKEDYIRRYISVLREVEKLPAVGRPGSRS